MVEVRPSICRLCTSHCPILVTIQDGAAVKIVGDLEAPMYDGYTCPKGRALPEQHYDERRLLHSLARDADGPHQPVGVETAMDEIAAKVQQLVERHGPRSVAFYLGTGCVSNPSGAMVGISWLRAVGSPMLFTATTIDKPGVQVAAALHGGWQGGQRPFEAADTWIMIGENPIISKTVNFPVANPGMRLKEAVDRGLKLIVIDPRLTETAKRAHIHLRPRPGEDVTILAGLLNIVISEGLYDTEFVAENVQGFETLKGQAARFTPAYVANRAEIPADQLIEAAHIFARAKSGYVGCGTGVSFAPHGTLAEYLAMSLGTICGRWARAGETVHQPNVLMPAYSAKAQPFPPTKGWGFGEKIRVRGLGDTAAGLPTAALADEMLLGGEGQVKALFCLGGNPMMAWPDQMKTFAALKKLELLVVLDPEMSATAKLADYVIAPRLLLETPGTTYGLESLKYMGPNRGLEKPFAQYSPKLVEPPPGSEVIEEWEFFYGLGQRMGLQLHWFGSYGSTGRTESPTAVIPLDMRNKPTTDELYERAFSNARIPFAEIKRYPHGHVFDEIQEIVQPRDPDNTDRLDVANRDMMIELDFVFDQGEAAREDRTHFPFLLIPRRLNQFLNSWGRNNPKLAGKRAYNPAFMHPDDLARLGAKSGDPVIIRSKHGVVTGIVEPDATLYPGLLSISHGFGGNPDEEGDPRTTGASTSRLMTVEEEYDPITGIPRMGGVPVAVELSDQGHRLSE